MNAARAAFLPCLLTALLAALMAAAPVRAAEPAALGRLFMTPEWRTNLERQRLHNIQEKRSFEGGSMRLDGVVVRSSGKATVWVNNQPQIEGSSDSGVVAATSPRRPERVTLSTGNEPAADLKVGVTLNRATRETASGLGDGEIRVNRPAPRK